MLKDNVPDTGALPGGATSVTSSPGVSISVSGRASIGKPAIAWPPSVPGGASFPKGCDINVAMLGIASATAKEQNRRVIGAVFILLLFLLN